MAKSTWGEWFIHEELEAVTPSGVSVWYLGCNGFVLRSATTTLYIDPYFGGSIPPRLLRMDPIPVDPSLVTECDAVFVTHEHLDHLHPPSYLPLIENGGADIYATQTAWDNPVRDDVEIDPIQDNVHAVAPGDTVTQGDITVHVRAGNDPDATGEVTYVFTHPAGTFFHGGDSRVAESFSDIGEEFDISLGVLAMGSEARQYYPDRDELVERRKVYMDHDEVIHAANLLELDRLAPSHFRMWKGVEADPAALAQHAASFDYPHVIEPVQVGDRLDLDSPGIVPQQTLQQLRDAD